MRSQLAEIRDQQRQTWDKFSSGWKKWDKLVLDWLHPVGLELVRSAALREDANVLDVAAGTGEPGITAAALVPKGMVTVTDLSEKMLEVAAENAARRGIRTFRPNNATPVLFLSQIAHSTPYCVGLVSCSSQMST
jgi:ubiquinone/menaquinone biosynthesis C-methylase UbiE